jgi:hypothetical protein
MLVFLYCLWSIFRIFFLNGNDDSEAKEYLDENEMKLNRDEEYFHSDSSSGVRANRLTKGEVADV